MKHARLDTILIAALALVALGGMAACKKIPAEAYFNRGSPESLMDYSSEVINLSIASAVEVNEFSSWVNRDQPTRAELYCTSGSAQCDEAKKVLDLFSVPYTHVPSSQATATLVYERSLARDCEQRYIDNGENHYNLNHPTFGCSLAANIVQHASDKKQIMNPNIMDDPYSTRSVQTYKRYLESDPTSAAQGGNAGGGASFGGGGGGSGGGGGGGSGGGMGGR